MRQLAFGNNEADIFVNQKCSWVSKLKVKIFFLGCGVFLGRAESDMLPLRKIEVHELLLILRIFGEDNVTVIFDFLSHESQLHTLHLHIFPVFHYRFPAAVSQFSHLPATGRAAAAAPSPARPNVAVPAFVFCT